MTATPWTNRLSVGQRSETGYVRSENQDRMSWVRTPVADVFVVLDGMGGHAGGGVAAELAVQVLQRHFEALTSLASVETVLRDAFNEANETVYARSQSGDPATHGMGTTAVAMLVADSRIMLAHVGDSRAYLFTRKGVLRGLTKDHSRIQRLVDEGLLTQAQAAAHPDAGVLERAIGHLPRVEVEISQWLRVRSGDACLLCTDGLCGYVGDADIAAVMRTHGSPQEHADELVKLALARGGQDNVTVQVIGHDRHPGFAFWHRLRAWATTGVAAGAPVVFVAVLGAGWLLSLPTQVDSERAVEAGIAALKNEMQHDREIADARFESTMRDLAAIRTRLDQLDRSVGHANAASTPVTPRGQKPPARESAQQAPGRHHASPAPRKAAMLDAAHPAGAQPRPESAPLAPAADGPDQSGS